MDRRTFVSKAALSYLALAGSVFLKPSLARAAANPGTQTAIPASLISRPSSAKRRQAALRRRNRINQMLLRGGFPRQKNNGEERDYPFLASYSKAMPHNGLGEVGKSHYRKLLTACLNGKPNDWENVPLGGPKQFKNPLAAFAFDTQGYDAQQLRLPPAPRLDGEQGAAEMAELYWMALCRDVPFSEYAQNEIVNWAAADLTQHYHTRFPALDPNNIFRASYLGCEKGPCISQFLYLDVPWGTLTLNQLQHSAQPATDYLTSYNYWLNAQNGFAPGSVSLEPSARYIQSGRDLGHFVHIDRVHQAFTHAALIIQFALRPDADSQFGANAPFDPGHPYHGVSSTMSGFATYDYPHLLSLVAEVTTRALKAAWFHKWLVHRRLRPEEFGGRVHNHLEGHAQYPLHPGLFESQALQRVFSQNGTYLLPQAYPEGCPPHPAYPSGHAAYAGACVTILKAWFDEDYIIPAPVAPHPSGSALVPYAGSGAGSMTLGGELNKLACNIGLGRLFAGIHYRSDLDWGLKLGEDMAISVLRSHMLSCREKASLSFTRFDGRRITVAS